MVEGIQARSSCEGVLGTGSLGAKEGFEFGHGACRFIDVSGLKDVRCGSPRRAEYLPTDQLKRSSLSAAGWTGQKKVGRVGLQREMLESVDDLF